MKRAIWVSVAVIAAATVLLVFGVRSLLVDDQPPGDPVAVQKQVPQRPDCPAGLDLPCPVSYTHLTLPTICSV